MLMQCAISTQTGVSAFQFIQHDSELVTALKNAQREKVLDDTYTKHIAFNPHNFPAHLNVSSPGSDPRRIHDPEIFSSSTLDAQINRTREFAIAKFLHASPLIKRFLWILGTCIVELVQKCYGSDRLTLQEKYRLLFDFQGSSVYTDLNGSVRVKDNLFLNHQRMPPDATVRELGASMTQALSLCAKNEQAFLEIIGDLADKAELKQACQGAVDFDFFEKLCVRCGKNENGSPHTALPLKRLPFEETPDGLSIEVRQKVAREYWIRHYAISELNLSERERAFHNVKDADAKVPRLTGAQMYRIDPSSQFAQNAQANHQPTTSGPSGTTFNIALAVRLLWPALKNKLSLTPTSDDAQRQSYLSKYLSDLFLKAMLACAHGTRAAEHHHSMIEVLQGCQKADELIKECYPEEERADVGFNYESYRIEDVLNEIREYARGFHQFV